MSPMLNGQFALVLNATLIPINICSWKKAVKLVYKGKALVIEESGVKINGLYDLPLVVRLLRYVPLPYQSMVLSRKNVYLRDRHACQYCGRTEDLTIDHVLPRSRGGEDNWENIVACCIRCNNKKGDRLLQEAGMKLRSIPFRPPSTLYLHMTRLRSKPSCWADYFFAKN